MDFEEEEFSSVVTDALAAAGVNTADLPEGWTTVKRKKKVPTLPNLPPHLFVDKMASPRYQEPEDEWEWEIDIYWHHYNLTADDDTLDVLKKLPPIPCNPLFPEMVPQDAPDDDDDDDEAWTSEIYRCISSQTSQFQLAMDGGKSLNQHDEMGLQDLGGLSDLSLNQSKEMELPDLDSSGLPDLPDLLPDLPHSPDDLEECFKNLLTDTPHGNDETLVSGEIPNPDIEMHRNDIPELDLANVPGAVPSCGVGAKKKEAKKIKKEAKKITKKVKKQLKKKQRDMMQLQNRKRKRQRH